MSFYEITKLDCFIWTKYSQDDIFVIACEGTLCEYDCCTSFQVIFDKFTDWFRLAAYHVEILRAVQTSIRLSISVERIVRPSSE